MAGILFIISAPSGSGKSTLVAEVRRLVEGLEFSISYTTRKPRGSEDDGREYHFTDVRHFLDMVSRDDFLEWAEVFGNYYGTARGGLEHARQAGKDLLLDIDVQGAIQVIQKVPEAVSIFVVPPSPLVLERRLRNRSQAEGVTDEAVIQRRLAQAKQELGTLNKYKYVLINDVLEEAVTELAAIVRFERGRGGSDGNGGDSGGLPGSGGGNSGGLRGGVDASEYRDAAAVAAQCRTTVHSPRLEAVLSSFDVSVAGV